MARLCAVRFRGTGVNDFWELALRISSSTPTADERLIFGDREVFCPSKMLKTSMNVDEQMMLCKAPVLYVVRRDREALRKNAPEYDDVRRERLRTSLLLLPACTQFLRPALQLFRELDKQLAKVDAHEMSQKLPRASRTRTGRSLFCSSADMIDRFERRQTESSRMSDIYKNSRLFRNTAQSLMPTSWVKTDLKVEGFQRIELTKKSTMKAAHALCKKQLIVSPSGVIKKNAFHYGRYENRKLVSLLSLRVANLNKKPGSVAVSIDIAASTETNHAMTIGINSIKKTLRKRRQTCVLLAQVAQTESARKFWNGKLTHTKRASVMSLLLYEFDKGYKIYEDVDDMALFYE